MNWLLRFPISGILKVFLPEWRLILDLSPRTLEKVLYFANYIVLDAGTSDLSYKQVLTEREYQDAREKYGDTFRVGMGAEAVQELLEAIDLERESKELKAGLKDSTGQKRARIVKRLEVVEAFRESGNTRMDDYECCSGYSTRFTSYGTVRRRSFCYLRLK